LERIFLGVQSVHNILSIGKASVFVLAVLAFAYQGKARI
jgi:hypothetical protein